MARSIKTKELVNTRLATNYGGWMYCDKCNQNIGYLCYQAYDKINLHYQCNCGSNGSVFIDFEDSVVGKETKDDFVMIKNRFCCCKDKEPFITLLDKKLVNYELEITCKSCHQIYKKVKV